MAQICDRQEAGHSVLMCRLRGVSMRKQQGSVGT